MKVETVYIGNTHLIDLTGLTSEVDDTPINDATVLASLLTAAGDAVSGATDIAMSYVTGSNGNYRGVLPETVDLSQGALNYLLDVRANGGEGKVGRWRFPVTAEWRR